MLGNSLMGPGSGDSWKYTTSGGADATLPVDPVNLFGYVSGATDELRQNTVAMTGTFKDGILQGERWRQFSQDTKDLFYDS